ncbi:MAG: hypothetical protein ACM3JH_03690 [Acidithiobacillales bacterium]
MKRFTWPTRALLVLVAPLAFSASSGAAGPPPERLPPVRKIPGLTAPDTHPKGCVDCHIQYPDRKLDERFSTLMAAWTTKVNAGLLKKAQAAAPAGVTLKGKHPKTPAMREIPRSCLGCHSKGSKTAPPFGQMIHLFHLTGGNENRFLTIFQGECTLCHKLDAATGQWTMPSGVEK